MAYIDKQLTVSDAQAVTATAVSQNSIDTGGTNPIRDIGVGEQMFMLFSTSVAATAVGAATVSFEIVEADDTALATNVTVLAATAPIPIAQLTVGFQTSLGLPRNTRRHVGTRYTVVNGPLTAGTFNASLVTNRDARRNYASGYSSAAKGG